MKHTKFFEQALELVAPWKVVDVNMDITAKKVEIKVDCGSAGMWLDPESGNDYISTAMSRDDGGIYRPCSLRPSSWRRSRAKPPAFPHARIQHAFEPEDVQKVKSFHAVRFSDGHLAENGQIHGENPSGL
jgi:hypothetical protein